MSLENASTTTPITDEVAFFLQREESQNGTAKRLRAKANELRKTAQELDDEANVIEAMASRMDTVLQ